MNDMSKISDQTYETLEGSRKSSRGRLFAVLGAAVVAVGGGWWLYDDLVLSRHATTDNAYVGADVAVVTPIVGGPIASIAVADTETVRRGDVLVRLDDTDARIRVAAAEAGLDAARRRISGRFADDASLAAQITAREAEVTRAEAQVKIAQADVDKTKIDLDRRKALAGAGSVSGDELTAVQTAHRNATAGLTAAEATLAQARAGREAAIGARAANSALIANTTEADHPEVRAARTALEQANVDLDRTIIRAPVDGVVSRRQVQIGQRVQPGAMLMVVVPLGEAYVDANFKEVQLAKVRAGQTVRLVSDLWGKDVTFTGRVVGFSGGTGAAFSIVPAQNATGNWIKVVQRLPVRIALDPAELAAHPLQVGLSMTVDVDVSK